MRVNLSTRMAERETDLIENSRNAKKWTRIFPFQSYIYISSPSIRSKIYLTYNNSIRAKEIEIRTNLRTKGGKIDGDGW